MGGVSSVKQLTGDWEQQSESLLLHCFSVCSGARPTQLHSSGWGHLQFPPHPGGQEHCRAEKKAVLPASFSLSVGISKLETPRL